MGVPRVAQPVRVEWAVPHERGRRRSGEGVDADEDHGRGKVPRGRTACVLASLSSLTWNSFLLLTKVLWINTILRIEFRCCGVMLTQVAASMPSDSAPHASCHQVPFRCV
jgi:hypothetical protein